MDDRGGHSVLGLIDIEVFKRALGLGAPIFGGIDLYLAKGICLDAGRL